MMSMERDQSKLDVPTLFLSGQWMAPPFAIYELTQNEKVRDWFSHFLALGMGHPLGLGEKGEGHRGGGC